MVRPPLANATLDCGFQFAAEAFIILRRTRNETLSVVAVRINNLNCLRSEETAMPRLTDHRSLITYHSVRFGRLAQW